MFSLLGMLALPLGMILLLGSWQVVAVSKGLMARTKRSLRCVFDSDGIELWSGPRLNKHVGWGEVMRARHAINENCTESRLVEDAVTLSDARGVARLKVPQSAHGFAELLALLASRQVVVEVVEVSAPSLEQGLASSA